MKLFFTTIMMGLTLGLSAQAAEVKGAKVNFENSTLEIEVAYGGGCEEHVFDISLGLCRETYPVSCDAQLLHTTKSGNPDFCEAYIHQTVEISLEDKGLLDSYFEGGSLTVFGDGESSATVTLP